MSEEILEEILTTENIGLTDNTTVSPEKPVLIATPAKSLADPAAQGQENVPADDKVVSPTVNSLTEAEKIKKRIEKFGVQSENVKKSTRAERFGIAVEKEKANGGAVAADPTKLNDRAARFGITKEEAPAAKDAKPKISAKVVPEVSAEALEKRAARFGTTKPEVKIENGGADDPLLNKRKERFGVVKEDDKKKLRSERFQKA